MKVTHSSLSGGYSFNGFEGQPDRVIQEYLPKRKITTSRLNSKKEMTVSEILKALDINVFNQPEGSLISCGQTIEPEDVTDIVINLVEVEPYNLPTLTVISDVNKYIFMLGLEKIHLHYPKAKISIVIAGDQNLLLKVLPNELKDKKWGRVVSISPKYPANHEAIIIEKILGIKYPMGYSPPHVGVLHLKLNDILQIGKVLSESNYKESVYVALAGPSWKENKVLHLPVGTSIQEIKSIFLEEKDTRIVKNSVLTGHALEDDAVITFDTSVLIALPEDRRRQVLFFLRGGPTTDSFSNTFLAKFKPTSKKTVGTNLHGERRVCVSCGYCQDVCPLGLIPHLLHKHGKREIINKRLAAFKIFDCIECGLCDYVCPSKIELSRDIIKAKDLLEKSEISHKAYVIPQCDMLLAPKEVTSLEQL